MNLSVETQQEVIFWKICVRFFCLLLSKLASKCVLDTVKSQNFPGEHAPGPPYLCQALRSQQAGLPLAAKLVPPNQKSCLQPCTDQVQLMDGI